MFVDNGAKWGCFSGWRVKIVYIHIIMEKIPKSLDELTILYMGVSKNRGTPKSSILIGFSIINHPFWGTPIFGNTHIENDAGNNGVT